MATKGKRDRLTARRREYQKSRKTDVSVWSERRIDARMERRKLWVTFWQRMALITLTLVGVIGALLWWIFAP